jgi:hypothetical protein
LNLVFVVAAVVESFVFDVLHKMLGPLVDVQIVVVVDGDVGIVHLMVLAAVVVAEVASLVLLVAFHVVVAFAFVVVEVEVVVDPVDQVVVQVVVSYVEDILVVVDNVDIHVVAGRPNLVVHHIHMGLVARKLVLAVHLHQQHTKDLVVQEVVVELHVEVEVVENMAVEGVVAFDEGVVAVVLVEQQLVGALLPKLVAEVVPLLLLPPLQLQQLLSLPMLKLLDPFLSSFSFAYLQQLLAHPYCDPFHSIPILTNVFDNVSLADIQLQKIQTYPDLHEHKDFSILYLL